MGEFPEGPRLELCAFIAIGPGSVPGQVTKIPKARVCGPKRKEKKKNLYIYIYELFVFFVQFSINLKLL